MLKILATIIPHISDWENGKTEPNESSLITIGLRYNVNLEWLKYDKGSMFKAEASEDLTPELKNMRVLT